MTAIHGSGGTTHDNFCRWLGKEGFGRTIDDLTSSQLHLS